MPHFTKAILIAMLVSIELPCQVFAIRDAITEAVSSAGELAKDVGKKLTFPNYVSSGPNC